MGTLSIDKLSLQGGTLAKVTDGDNSTFAHFAEDPYKGGTIKDYIPIDASLILTFKNPKKLGTINFVQDSKTDNMRLNIQLMVKIGKKLQNMMVKQQLMRMFQH